MFAQDDSNGQNFKKIAIFNGWMGLQNKCVQADRPMDTMSMWCGLGGPTMSDLMNESNGNHG